MHTGENNKIFSYDAILDEVADKLIVTDEDFTILFINKSAINFLGLSSDNIGKSLKEQFDFHSTQLHFPNKNSIIENSSNEFQVSFVSKKSDKEFKVIVKKIKKGSEVNYLCTFQHSTQDQKEEVKGIEHRLFNTVMDGVFLFNKNGQILDANPAACRIFKRRKEELLQLGIHDIFPHKSKEEFELIWAEFISQGYLEGFYKFDIGKNDFRYLDFRCHTNFYDDIHISVFQDLTENVKNEKALKKSEANLKAIFNNTNQRFILLDRDDRIVTFNPIAREQALKRFGKELTAGESIFTYADETIKLKFGPSYAQMKAGQTVYIEYSFLYNSSEHWLEVGFIPILDNKGVTRGGVISVGDITNRKKAELNLTESEARFRSLVQNSSDIFIIIEKDTTIKYSSASIQKILGYNEELLYGKKLLDYIHEDDKAHIEKSIQRIGLGEPYNPVLEYRFIHSEGFYVYLETNCNNLLNNEHINGIVLNTRDITERKYQEENLLLLERAIDSSSNGILITDPNQPDNPVIYVNKAFEQLSGYNYFDIIGKNMRVLQGTDVQQEDIEVVRNAIKVQNEVKVVLRNYKKDGSLFWNQLSISPVFNRNGELANYIGVINDITEKKIADDALLEITQGVSSHGDFDIYKAIVTHIGVRLQMDLVYVGDFEGDVINMKSLYKDGEIVPMYNRPIKGTPCLDVLERGTTCIYDNIVDSFPEAELLAREKFFAFMGVPLKDSSGKTMGILGIMSRSPFKNPKFAESILEILSVRVSAELERDAHLLALKSSEQRFKDLAENSPDIVYMIDLEARRIIYFNRKELFGYQSEELTFSEAWERIVHPEDVALVIDHWTKFLDLSSSTTQELEYRIRKKSGEYEWINNRHIALERNQDGTVKKVLLNITIITERKKAEEALRESQARLTALVENTSDIVWSVDKDLVFTTMNSSLQRLFNLYYDRRISVGDDLKEVLPESIKEEWILLHNYVMEGKSFSVEFVIKENNQELSYEVSYNPIFSTEGNVSGVSVFGRDITERKSVENDIIRTNFELDSFVYRASHDLRAPLRSVLGLVNLAKEEEDIIERNTYLGYVEKSVNKLDSFISDLTNFSRNSRLEITPELIDFKMVIEECLENLKYMDNTNMIRTIVNISGEVDFHSDRTRINIILQNIISNAIKYLNRRVVDSFVQIDISISKEAADIVITDNGRGIREEYLDKIFNMFFRASQDSYGSGLGLYITKQVVEKLSGTIEVFSELGNGTKFVIRLPNANKEIELKEMQL